MPYQPRTLVILLTLLCLPHHGTAQTPSPPAERAIFSLTNHVRAQYHLPPLSWDPALAAAARAHADHLLHEPGPLEHQYPGEADLVTRAAQAGAHFSVVSENLARRGTSPSDLEQAWLSTPIHRANLLDPHLTAIGIGVLTWNGLLYAVQDFARAAPVLESSAIEAHVSQLLRTEGLASVTSSRLARSVCESHATTAPEARLLVQWDGDTSQLPGVLVQQLRHSQFRSAAVGACATAQPDSGFTSARVAVLLF